MNRQRDGLPRAPMRQADVRGQHAVREPRQRLLGGVRVDRRQAAEMAGVERLQQVERFRTAHLADEDAIGTMAERRAHQVGDGHGGHRLFLAERHLRSSRLEPNEVRLVDEDLGRLFDQHDAVAEPESSAPRRSAASSCRCRCRPR